MENLYCVVYRTGGTENFEWHHTLPVDESEVNTQLDEVKRMGYKCYKYKYSSVLNIGLPETYDASTPLTLD